MLKLTLTFLTLVVVLDRAHSWKFNRFSPEMLNNLGYGNGGNNRPGSQVSFIISSSLYIALETDYL